MTRSVWSSTMRAAVVLPALLVVLLAAPLPPASLAVVAAPEGELNWTEYLFWSPAGELAFLPGLDSRVRPRGAAPVVSSASTVSHEPLETRK
jgi:hypothetical protein